MATTPPIGVFDSGIGGLSVLQALRAELPHERFIYLADSGHAPYGERDAAHVIERAQAITRHLLTQHRIKALVVACNTATAAAIHLLRKEHPALPIVGVEPPLKPAAQLSRTHRVGVMATRGTLESAKFRALLESLAGQAEFILQACDGLAAAIERWDTAATEALCAQYTQGIGPYGQQPGEVDIMVLGCTHYPFATRQLRALLGPDIQLIDSGAPVARQTRRLLEAAAALATQGHADVQFYATGFPERLRAAASHWLQLDQPAGLLTI